MHIDLEVTRRGLDGVTHHPFDRPSVRIGRDDSCELQLVHDPHIGRAQCALEWHAGTLFLFPLRASIDTLLNDKRLTHPAPLKPGDKVQVGSYFVRVSFAPTKPVFPNDAPRLLVLRITLPDGTARQESICTDLLRLCLGAKSDVYLGEEKPARFVAQESLEALLFWSMSGKACLLLHKYSTHVFRNGGLVDGIAELQEGDRLDFGSTVVEILEVKSPADPPRKLLHLLLFEENAPPRWHSSTRQRIVFGSSPKAEVCLSDRTLPEGCFSIDSTSGQPVLVPMQPEPTLYCNFDPVSTNQPLKHGDRLCMADVLVHVDTQTPASEYPTHHGLKLALLGVDADEEDTEILDTMPFSDAAVRLGTVPFSHVLWPPQTEQLVDFWLLWHADNTLCLHVGMWSSEVFLDGHKQSRCTLIPIHQGSILECAKVKVLVLEAVISPATEKTPS